VASFSEGKPTARVSVGPFHDVHSRLDTYLFPFLEISLFSNLYSDVYFASSSCFETIECFVLL